MSHPYTAVSKQIGLKENVFDDFISFISKGSIVDLAVGSVLGAAFTTVVNTLSQDILVPLVSSSININMTNDFIVWQKGKNYPYKTLQDAEEDGAITIRYGKVLEKCISFMVQALALYFIIRAYKQTKTQFKKWQPSR